MRPLWFALLLGWVLAGAAAVGVGFARGACVPTPDELLQAAEPSLDRYWLAVSVAAGSGFVASIAMLLGRRVRSATPFGVVVGLQIAVGLPGLAILHLPVPALGAGVGVVAVLVARELSSRLSDGGLAGLALGGAVAALPHVFALRAAHALAVECLPIAAAHAAVAGLEPALLGLVVEPDLEPRLLEAYRRWLRVPWRRAAFPVLVARGGEPAAVWLAKLSGPTFVVGSREWLRLSEPQSPLRRDLQLEVERLAPGGGERATLTIRRRGLKNGGAVHVLTSAGSVSGEVDGEGPAEFTPEQREKLCDFLESMPPNAPIRIVVEPHDLADPPGWTELSP